MCTSCSAPAATASSASRGGIGGLADALRRRVDRSLAPGLDGERRAVVAGVVLGEDEGLDQELRDDFRASGLYHLLAVSGQNVAYVIAGALLLAWGLGLPRWAGQVAALLSVLAYVAAVGWQPSVVRAGVAGSLASLGVARLAARRPLVCASGGSSCPDGGARRMPSWSRAFSCRSRPSRRSSSAVPRVERRLEGYPLPRRLAAALAVSAACGIVTAPILWLEFGSIPVYSVLGNALAEPVVAPLLALAFAATLLDPILPAAALALGWLNGWLAAYLALSARLVGGLPHAQVSSARRSSRPRRRSARGGPRHPPSPSAWPARSGTSSHGGGSRSGLALGRRACSTPTAWGPSCDRPRRRAGRLHPAAGGAGCGARGRGPSRGRGRRPATGAGSLQAGDHRPHPPASRPCGRRGGDPRPASRSGSSSTRSSRHTAPTSGSALAEARQERVRIVPARVGLVYRLGRLSLRVLWPDGSGVEGEDPHHHAVVLLATYGSFDVLLTADAESEVTLPLRPPPVEVLKVAHHGSSDPGFPSSSSWWIPGLQ